ncbi:MAG: PilZ domain-containing protein [Hyphomicrobiaceae bacterium]
MNNRRFTRFDCDLSGILQSKHGSFQCHVSNISAGGVAVSHDHLVKLSKGERLGLSLADLGTHRVEVMWTGSGQFGARFVKAIDEQVIRKLLA